MNKLNLKLTTLVEAVDVKGVWEGWMVKKGKGCGCSSRKEAHGDLVAMKSIKTWKRLDDKTPNCHWWSGSWESMTKTKTHTSSPSPSSSVPATTHTFNNPHLLPQSILSSYPCNTTISLSPLSLLVFHNTLKPSTTSKSNGGIDRLCFGIDRLQRQKSNIYEPSPKFKQITMTTHVIHSI